MPIIFYYSAFVAITSFAVGLCCLYNIWKNQILTPAKSFFWHYSIGFLVWAFSQSLSLLVNSGIQINYPSFVSLRIISFLATLVTYYFFVRGTTSLFVKSRFMATILPLIYGFAIASFLIYALLMTEIKSIIISTVVFWGIILPVNLFLGFAFLYIFIKGTPFDSTKRKPSAFVLSFAWLYIFVLNVILWFSLVNYPREFYLLKLSASKEWFIARAIGHLLILIGFIFYCGYLRHLKIPEYLKLLKRDEKQQ